MECEITCEHADQAMRAGPQSHTPSRRFTPLTSLPDSEDEPRSPIRRRGTPSWAHRRAPPRAPSHRARRDRRPRDHHAEHHRRQRVRQAGARLPRPEGDARRFALPRRAPRVHRALARQASHPVGLLRDVRRRHAPEPRLVLAAVVLRRRLHRRRHRGRRARGERNARHARERGRHSRAGHARRPPTSTARRHHCGRRRRSGRRTRTARSWRSPVASACSPSRSTEASGWTRTRRTIAGPRRSAGQRAAPGTS